MQPAAELYTDGLVARPEAEAVPKFREKQRAERQHDSRDSLIFSMEEKYEGCCLPRQYMHYTVEVLCQVTRLDEIADATLPQFSSRAAPLSLAPCLPPPFICVLISYTMARRKAANGLTIDSAEATDAATEPSTNLTLAPIPDADRDLVKVNNASASELKTACDDALKRVRVSRQCSLHCV